MLPRELSSFTGGTCIGAQPTSLPLKKPATQRRPFVAEIQGTSQNIPLSPFKWPPGELLFHPGATSLLLWSLSPRPRCSPATQEIHKQHKFHICVISEDSAELPRLKLDNIQTAETLHTDKRFWTISCFPSVGWVEFDSMFTAYAWKSFAEVFVPVNGALTRGYVFYTLLSWNFFHFVYIICR